MGPLIFLLILWGIFSGIAYLTYKLGDAPSWEESLSRFVSYIIAQTRELFNSPCEDLENMGFALTDNEPLQLVETFEQQPYETPVLASYRVVDGLMVFDIRTAGLSSKYSNFEENSPELRRLLGFKVYNYFARTRGVPVHVCIRFATPTRFYFAVPFTDSAREKLAKYEAKRRLQRMQAQSAPMPGDGKTQSPQDSPAVLEERVSAIKNGTEGGSDDDRISP